MQCGTFLSQRARVLPLLKKPILDPDTCSSYRPISNLSFISKLIERVVVRLPMYRSLISSRISSLLTGHFTPLKPLFSLCVTLLFVPLTITRYLYLCYLIWVALSTRWTTTYFCQSFTTTLVLLMLPLTGSGHTWAIELMGSRRRASP